MSHLRYPLHSLRKGDWFKLICGASFQHLPAIRNLALAYTLAGADCIDVAADPAVIAAAREGVEAALRLTEFVPRRQPNPHLAPLLMVSLNDGEDPHFRKAEFDPTTCPADCPRPCKRICPAEAIVFGPDNSNESDESSTLSSRTANFSGVIDRRCYGCGRCIPICPFDRIVARSYISTPTTLGPLILENGVDALEIHTQTGHLTDFERLWQAIEPWLARLKLIAISCPDGPHLIDYLQALHQRIAPLPCPLIWQTDGRPMSGDIGAGTTTAAVKLSQKVLAAGLPGYVQLAGGTNHHTVDKLKATGLLPSAAEGDEGQPGNSPLARVAGVAYGSYARKLLSTVLEQLEPVQTIAISSIDRSHSTRPQSAIGQADNLQITPVLRLEDRPDLLRQAVDLADSLVSQLKSDS
ncbi:MAG: LdpA C-terminal domain-containing domain [Cyanobacteriota bacterium]|nr:LdpA C-terminal domain-containing domain [Cyanobacteriota bacterium]